jgi:uncharacterized phage protein gp47/JayE
VSPTSQTPDAISASILATLATTAPQLSCAVGTPERQIVDACAAQISAAYMGQYLNGGMMDINTKSGLELDQFVGIWGFGRLQGSAATGTLTVTTTNVSSSSLQIPLGSQFYTTPGLAGLSATIYFASTQAVTLPAGSFTCSVPIQCTTVGTAGNVPPDSITSQSAAIGASTVTNLGAMTGGTNVETDAQLRQRFMDTMLRNISGTKDWYINLALQNNNVSRVAVYGPVSLYSTQIAVPTSTLTLDVTSDVKYVWCLVPETRVLTEELDWVPVGSLRIGDRLIGFDEYPLPGRGRKRCWKPAEVTAASMVQAPTFEVRTTGPSVRCTGDHLWLVSQRGPIGQAGKKRGVVRNAGNVQWVKTKDLVPGDKIRFIPPWEQDSSFEAGYLSGIFDGEGSSPHGTSCVDIAQNPGAVFDKIISLLKQFGFDSLTIYDSRSGSRSPNPRCKQIVVNGGVAEMMRFFGTFKPARLLPKFLKRLYGTAILGGGRGIEQGTRYVEVLSVSPHSTETVVALGTSTQTLVAEGLLSHNTNGNSCFTNLGTSSETFYSPVDDFTMSTGASPVFTRVTSGALVVGAIVDLEFQYTTQSSRNDPANGITNKVDVFVDGVAPFSVTETTVVSSTTLSSSSSNVLYTGNFERVGASGTPSSSNRFMRLGSTPVVNFPSSITVSSTVYTRNTHYYLLAGTTSLKGSQLEVAGLEWLSSGPANGTQLVLNYSYNQVPQLLDAITRSSKQICTDVLNHVADYQYITTCLTVEYGRNFAITTTNTAIVSRLQIFYQTLGFGGVVIFSQLEAAVQQVLGVNEVHITTSAEATAAGHTDYGIEVFDNSTDTTPTTINTSDFVLNDNQLAVYQNTITLQAPNIGGGGGG